MKIFFIIAVVLLGVNGKGLNKSFDKCSKNDPRLNQCIISAIEKVQPRLAKGISELSVPSFNPLAISKLNVNKKLTSVVADIKLKKLKIFNLNDFKIKSLKVDAKNFKVDMTLRIPYMVVSSHYEIAGRVLLVPLDGKGSMKGNFTGISMNIKATGSPTKIKNKEYLQFDKLAMNVNIGNGKITLKDDAPKNALAFLTNIVTDTAENAVTGECRKMLNRVNLLNLSKKTLTNICRPPSPTKRSENYFNSNSRMVLDLLSPIIDEMSEAVFKPLLNKSFGFIPVADLFTDTAGPPKK